MPFMKNGNARDYVRNYPSCDRLQIVCLLFFVDFWPIPDGLIQLHHVSLGLVYLHSRQIVHGDVKAVNIAYYVQLRAFLSVIL